MVVTMGTKKSMLPRKFRNLPAVQYARDNGWDVEQTSNGHLKFTKEGRPARFAGSTPTPAGAQDDLAKLRRADRQYDLDHKSEDTMAATKEVGSEEVAEILGIKKDSVSALASQGRYERASRGKYKLDSVIKYRDSRDPAKAAHGKRGTKVTTTAEAPPQVSTKVCQCPLHTGDKNVPADTEHFNKQTKSKDGLQPWCRECTSKVNKARREKFAGWQKEYGVHGVKNVTEYSEETGLSLNAVKKMCEAGELLAIDIGMGTVASWRIAWPQPEPEEQPLQGTEQVEQEVAVEPVQAQQQPVQASEATLLVTAKAQNEIAKHIGRLEAFVLSLPEELREEAKFDVLAIETLLQDCGFLTR